jgi:DNA-binding PadR family transcriptional regulator
MLSDVIELGILGVLREAELHGYELKKRLRDVLGPLSSVSFGSLYPALNRLEAAGLVKAVEAADVPSAPAMPMTGSFTGEVAAFRASRRRTTRGPRGKKVYGLTETGHTRLDELLADPADDEKTFALKLAFCRWCEPDVRLALLERRRAALVARRDEGLQSLSDRGTRLDRYVRSLLEHDTESTERDIAWIDQLIQAEKADDHTGGTSR